MSSHGNTPSRERNEDAAFVRLPSDSSQDYSHGGRTSRDPLADALERAKSGASRTNLKFPEADRYQQLSEPIPGGMGVIFKALDKRLGIVAIKRIRPELANNTEQIQRFEREAKLQFALKHQHLVSVKEFGSDSYGPYIVLDWIDGQSLASVIRKTGAMPWRDAAILISKVAMAIQEAHENNIIHRDVKPGNILLDKKGEPYITDFGLACADSASIIGHVSEMNAAVGTQGFMSPEQRQNPKDVTHLTDMWSLGATLYQLLTTYGMMDYDPELIPEELRSAVTKALKRTPSERFGTMKLFAQELILCVSNNGPKPPPAKVAAPPAEEDIADIWRKAQERTDKLHADAKSIAERKQDYAAAVQIMEHIPEHVRNKKLYDELIGRRDRVQQLETTIRTGVGNLRSEGLRNAVAELLKLQPNRQDMKKLLPQLPPELPKPVIASLLRLPEVLVNDEIEEDAFKPVPKPGPSQSTQSPTAMQAAMLDKIWQVRNTSETQAKLIEEFKTQFPNASLQLTPDRSLAIAVIKSRLPVAKQTAAECAEFIDKLVLDRTASGYFREARSIIVELHGPSDTNSVVSQRLLRDWNRFEFARDKFMRSLEANDLTSLDASFQLLKDATPKYRRVELVGSNTRRYLAIYRWAKNTDVDIQQFDKDLRDAQNDFSLFGCGMIFLAFCAICFGFILGISNFEKNSLEITSFILICPFVAMKLLRFTWLYLTGGRRRRLAIRTLSKWTGLSTDFGSAIGDWANQPDRISTIRDAIHLARFSGPHWPEELDAKQARTGNVHHAENI